MKLQQLISENDLDLSFAHIRGFYLGVLTADKPLSFKIATEELLIENPEAIKPLEAELKVLFDALQKNHPYELQNFFDEKIDQKEFLNVAKEQLDFFLTALTLSGTNTENCKNEDMAELLEELEDSVMDIEDFLVDGDATSDEAKELKDTMLQTWRDFVRAAQAK